MKEFASRQILLISSSSLIERRKNDPEEEYAEKIIKNYGSDRSSRLAGEHLVSGCL
jgi:hypothetical protein